MSCFNLLRSVFQTRSFQPLPKLFNFGTLECFFLHGHIESRCVFLEMLRADVPLCPGWLRHWVVSQLREHLEGRGPGRWELQSEWRYIHVAINNSSRQLYKNQTNNF